MLADAEPRPRRLAVGEFDGVHLGHREVIAGSDTVLTFEPHPLAVVRPEAAPKLLTSLDAKAELIAELGVARAGRDPVRRRASPPRRRRSSSITCWSSALQATHVSVGENFRFGHRRRRRRRPAGRRRPLRDPRRAAGRGRRRDRLLEPHPRARARPARSSTRPGFLGVAVPAARRGRARRPARPRRSASRPPTSSPTRSSSARATASTPPAPTAPARPSASACGRRSATGRAVLVEAFLLDFDGDLYGQMLTVDFLARLRGERRFDSRRGAGRADAPRRRATRECGAGR